MRVLLICVALVGASGEESCTSQMLLQRGDVQSTAINTKIEKTYGYSYDGFSQWTPLSATVDPTLVLGGTGKKTFSQAGQDWLVQSILGCPHDGFFLELAAYEPERISNSLMVERDFNWAGLCVEANQDKYAKFASRHCTLIGAAVGSPTDKEVTFDVHTKSNDAGKFDQAAFSGIVGDDMDNKKQGGLATTARRLHTIALADLLDKFKAPRVIDYFSLDVEGAESFVMEDFPWDKYTFRVLTVERPKTDLKAQLERAGYKLLREDSLGIGDGIWIHAASFSDIDNLIEQWKSGGNGGSCMKALGYEAPSTVK